MASEVQAGRVWLYPYYVLFVLGLVNTFNFIDRHIVSVLLVPIKEEFQVSDAWLGILTGMAFMLVHSIFGIPIARYADRSVRRSIIALGVAVWSAMTALSGLARNFWQLLFLRMGVGIGEAAGAPPAHSLISDYFEPARRATALALYGMGIYAGIMFGYFAAGWIGEYFGWRLTFVAVGLPGLALAVLVRLTIREPRRTTSVSSYPFGEVFRYLFTKPSYLALLAAAAFHAFSAYSAAHWAPTFLRRVHGMTLSEIGTWLGIISGLGGAAGALLGGALADRLGRRDARWYPYVAATAAFGAIPCAALFLLSEDPGWALVYYTPYIVLVGAYVGPLHAMNQWLAKPRMRAMSVAIHLFTVSVIGGGLGPWLVGWMNDALGAEYGELGIRYSLLIAVGIGSALAGLFYFATSINLRRDIAKAEEPD